MVILLTGLVFLGNYAYQNWIRHMSNGIRLTALFLCAGLLIEAGRRLAKNASLHRFGEVLLAGGMAFFYYCTFAAHHVARLKVIDSPALGAALLFLSAGAIAAVSWVRQAKVTAAFGLVLASYATMLQPIGWMSCVSNVLLAAIGLFFMLKPGWSGPVWASMLGSYAAFLGSQILGRYQFGFSSYEVASMWFISPLWVMFAVPGVFGRFQETMSDRARAWFTGLNNALFFIIFSALWYQLENHAEYWKVAAVFGSVLVALGIIGRRQDTTAGGVNLSQGLGVVTLAIVLKLDGHQLALVLAVESLTLAVAAWKYRGRSEAVFSLISGIGGAGLMVLHTYSLIQTTPIWSIVLTFLTITAASCVMVRVRPLKDRFGPFIRFASIALMFGAAWVATLLCVSRLEHLHGMLVAAVLAAAYSAAFLKLDAKRYQPESIVGSIWFLLISCGLSAYVDNTWPLGATSALFLTNCWLWHREPNAETDGAVFSLSPLPGIPAWLFSFGTSLFVWNLAAKLSPGFREDFIFHQVAALAVLAIAMLLRCQRLTVTTALPALFSLVLLADPDSRVTWHLFSAVVTAFFAAGLQHTTWGKGQTTLHSRTASSAIFRLTAFLAYVIGWYHVSPEAWGDWLAITSVTVVMVLAFLNRGVVLECLAWIVIAMLWLFMEAIITTWDKNPDGLSWRGVMVVVSLLVLTLVYKLRPSAIDQFENRKDSLGSCVGLTCFMLTLWTTQMLVWRFDWKPAAVLWTILGFTYVSAGLWQRLHVARVFGFVLLAGSLLKVFASDVWDFTAFMRVVSFIVLGAALILLGLFYNKFAPAIKALLDSEK
jgi:hypothetical protein